MKIHNPANHYDVVVIGGGMVGASFAHALRQAIDDDSFSILVVEAIEPGTGEQQPSFDARSTALSFGSRQIFESMGLWTGLCEQVTPIKAIQVSDRGNLGSARMSHEEQGTEALGYVVENRCLGQVLSAALDANPGIAQLMPAVMDSIRPTTEGMKLLISQDETRHELTAALVVLADGGRSPACEQLGIRQSKDEYQQHALIANLAFEQAHHNTAFERFTETGPLAVLPLDDLDGQHRGALVWTLEPELAEQYLTMAEQEVLDLLGQCFGSRLGKLTHIGERACYPLALTVAKEQVRPGLVLLGNVAHTLHPVAGQGLNLALRDSQALVGQLAAAHDEGTSPGAMAVLSKYLEAQQADQQRTINATHWLTKLFSSSHPMKTWARKFGLLAIDLVPAVRRTFAEHAMGIGRR